MMTTLTQIPLHFNRSIQLSSGGGALSSDTDELIFSTFDEKLGFSQLIAKHKLASISQRQFKKNLAPWKNMKVN